MTVAETVADQQAPIEDFAAMLEESFQQKDKIEGTVVTGTVISIENDEAVVDVGLKAEGRVPIKEFSTPGKSRRSQGRRQFRDLCRAVRKP